MPGYSDGCKHLGERDGSLIWCELKKEWVYILDCNSRYCETFEEQDD